MSNDPAASAQTVKGYSIDNLPSEPMARLLADKLPSAAQMALTAGGIVVTLRPAFLNPYASVVVLETTGR